MVLEQVDIGVLKMNLDTDLTPFTKISNKQSNLTPKATRERRTAKPKVSRRKEIIKIRAEINEIETKKRIAKVVFLRR